MYLPPTSAAVQTENMPVWAWILMVVAFGGYLLVTFGIPWLLVHFLVWKERRRRNEVQHIKIPVLKRWRRTQPITVEITKPDGTNSTAAANAGLSA